MLPKCILDVCAMPSTHKSRMNLQLFSAATAPQEEYVLLDGDDDDGDEVVVHHYTPDHTDPPGLVNPDLTARCVQPERGGHRRRQWETRRGIHYRAPRRPTKRSLLTAPLAPPTPQGYPPALDLFERTSPKLSREPFVSQCSCTRETASMACQWLQASTCIFDITEKSNPLWFPQVSRCFSA